MPKLRVMTGVAGAWRRLRGLPRALYEDLWAVPVDPLPAHGPPGAPEWRPVLAMLLSLAAAVIALVHVYDLVPPGAGIPGYASLLVVCQSGALVAGLFRPLHAWWVSLALMCVGVRISEPVLGAGELFPTASEIALVSGALFLLALRVPPRRAVTALVVTLLATALATQATTRNHAHALDRASLIIVTAAAIGTALRTLRVSRTELAEQSELTAEERARRTLLEERNRIARELHDVVAHHMSVISIQAQVARHLVADPTPELLANLADIRGNAVDALTELRQVLGVLRAEDSGADAAPHAPQPTLDLLDELVGRVRATGVEVSAHTTGTSRPLPPGVGLSAYRIVQEALSNVLRHAPGARARVEVGHHAAAVTVRVTNSAARTTTTATALTGPGHGLLGMHERAAMLGGDLIHGPTPGGGYEVLVTLPLEDPS